MIRSFLTVGKTSIVIVTALLSFVGVADAEMSSKTSSVDVDRTAKSSMHRFDEIRRVYHALPPEGKDVKRLVELDGEINAIVEKIQSTDKAGVFKKYWQQEYEQIGLYIGHYSDTIGYSGKLLVEAHRRNPNSPYRAQTLFTTILGEGDAHGLGRMPNLEQAQLYLKEFPNGPYAKDTYAVIGYFYDDLSKVLKALKENDKEARDYKYDCFAPFVSKEPYDKQIGEARAQAIRHLEKAIALKPASKADTFRRETLAAIKNGSNSNWHWCAD